MGGRSRGRGRAFAGIRANVALGCRSGIGVQNLPLGGFADLWLFLHPFASPAPLCLFCPFPAVCPTPAPSFIGSATIGARQFAGFACTLICGSFF